MRDKKILALDMDGTSLNDKGVLTTEVMQAINLAQRNNCIVCFVTGRRDIDIAPILGHCKTVDYLLMNNGAKIVDLKKKKVWFNKLVDCEAAKNLVKYCIEQKILLYVTAGLFWAVNYMTDGVKEYAFQLGSKPALYTSYEDLPVESIDGFMATNGGIKVAKFIKEHNMPLYCLQSEPNCFDIVTQDAGKWRAIELLARELGVKRCNIIAAGNYTNDMDMIVGAGIGIAVSNALQDLKDAADYITLADNNNNAIGEIVQKFVIN